MSDIFKRSIDATFERLGEVANYQAQGRISVDILVLREETAAEINMYGKPLTSDAGVFSLRESDIEASPETGDVLVLSGEKYEVKSHPDKTHRGLVWKIEAQPVD